ncbi:MAG: SGNH/GDSL hydrolase family protein [Gemmatimonadales bacterium]
MESELAAGRRWKLIRIAAAVVGGSIALLALLGDRLGLGDTGGFGASQALAAVLGAALAAIGWAGSRTPALYREAALMLLNTIVLLGLFELGAALLLRVISPHALPQTPAGDDTRASYYRAKDWSEAYWLEFEQVRSNYQYHPYQIWRMGPFEGRLIRIGPSGLRDTPGAECVPGAYVVDVFGGSTVWGLGVPDWGTVPAYLQAALRQARQGPVCVRNLGQLGLNSTQDLIALLGELRAGRIPDLVVFLSGVNDVIPAFQHGEAGMHFDIQDIAGTLEGLRNRRARQSLSLSWLKRLNLYRLGSWIRGAGRREPEPGRFRYEGTPHMSDTLAQSIVRVWLANYRAVEALGREYGFGYGFFWQPTVLVGRKPLTAEEERFKAGERFRPLFELVDGHLASVGPPEYPFLHNLVDVFEGDSSPIYVDWHHLTPEGNQRVADAIAVRLAANRQGRRAR